MTGQEVFHAALHRFNDDAEFHARVEVAALVVEEEYSKAIRSFRFSDLNHGFVRLGAMVSLHIADMPIEEVVGS